MNNYEKIKNMSIEEMAELLIKVRNKTCMFCKTCQSCSAGDYGIVKYLQQEAQE